MNFTIPSGNQYGVFFTIAYFVLWAIIHIIFAIAVYNDSKKIEPKLVGSFLWSFITLIGGPLFAGVYWAVNRIARNEGIERVASTQREQQRQISDVEQRLSKFKAGFNRA